MRWLAKPLSRYYRLRGFESPSLRPCVRRALGTAFRLYALCALVALAGCVEHKLLVRSDPPGATVFVDGREVGATGDGPVVVPFDFYGTRVVTARLAGHPPVSVEVELDPPWWQVFPLGFFTDVLWPGTIEDVHEPDVVNPLRLERRPQVEPGTAEVEARARHFAESAERRP